MNRSDPDTASLRPQGRAAAPEIPTPSGVDGAAYGSDLVADTLRSLGINYIAINPGASYRGLHDSIVNYLGNANPQLLVCLHEEAAVAIAHGWAKVTGRAMAAAVHSNVGLFHATMAIFNAWCDRMPILLIGATGPVDAMKRRPWIDWIHTARDQGAIVRGFTKWDDQPASAEAACESLARAFWLANAVPQAPTHVVLDAGMQEAPLSTLPASIDVARLVPEVVSGAAPAVIERIANKLRCRRTVILAGRASRGHEPWTARVALAEALGARVVTDLKIGAAFPTDHPLHVGQPAVLLPTVDALTAIREADVVLSLDWVDLAGTMRAAEPECRAEVIQVSLDHTLHNGWSMDYQGLAKVDLLVAADADAVAMALANQLALKGDANDTAATLMMETPCSISAAPDPVTQPGPLSVEVMALTLRRRLADRPVSLLHLPLSWNGAWWPFRGPLDFIGSDGGGGVGGGPGISVGAALALKGSGRLPVSICGDGDFLMGATALWTATHYEIPLLMVVANNRSFFNDELHQERVARARGRPVENRWIGQRLADPEIDLAGLARAQGALAFGPIHSREALGEAYDLAMAAVAAGRVAVVDVHVEPEYAPVMTQTMLHKDT